TEFTEYRLGHLILGQGIEGILEGRIEAVTLDVTQIATTVAGTGILGELPGQLGKILTGINARLDRLGLLAGGRLITIHLEQDVAGPTLLGQIADLALVHGFQSRLLHFSLVEEV